MEEAKRAHRLPRLILVGINYTPEVTGIAPYNAMLAEWLVQQGWDVEVISTFPYYPAWKKLPGDAGKLYRREDIEGVTVHRVWHYVPAKVTALRRMIHEATFPRRSPSSPPYPSPGGCSLSRLPSPSPRSARLGLPPALPPPLRLSRAGSPTRCRRGLGDAQTGNPHSHALPPGSLCLQSRRTGFGHQPRYARSLPQKGRPPGQKPFSFPIPSSSPTKRPFPAPGKFREAHAIPKDVFLVSYSGNLGVKQGLGQILEAAELLRNESSIHFVICGDGAEREKLAKSVAGCAACIL